MRPMPRSRERPRAKSSILPIAARVASHLYEAGDRDQGRVLGGRHLRGVARPFDRARGVVHALLEICGELVVARVEEHGDVAHLLVVPGAIDLEDRTLGDDAHAAVAGSTLVVVSLRGAADGLSLKLDDWSYNESGGTIRTLARTLETTPAIKLIVRLPVT